MTARRNAETLAAIAGKIEAGEVLNDYEKILLQEY